MAKEAIAYDKAELRAIVGAFKAMEDQAVDEAKRASGALAEYLQGKIINAASNTRNQVDDRVAQGSKVSKTSKIGEISLGFARQKFSGGATTQTLWGGSEFGSNKYKQFPSWSGKLGRGSRGWYIYPTLRAEQPELIRKWELSFDRIVKEFD
jgi:hypothetical protein